MYVDHLPYCVDSPLPIEIVQARKSSAYHVDLSSMLLRRLLGLSENRIYVNFHSGFTQDLDHDYENFVDVFLSVPFDLYVEGLQGTERIVQPCHVMYIPYRSFIETETVIAYFKFLEFMKQGKKRVSLQLRRQLSCLKMNIARALMRDQQFKSYVNWRQLHERLSLLYWRK